MKIPELEAQHGDYAIFIKDNGLYMCKLRCHHNNEWYIESMIGNWAISNDGLQIDEGILIDTSAIVKSIEKD